MANLEFIEQLINAAVTPRTTQATIAQYAFDPHIFTPEVCLRMSDLLKYLNDDLLKKVEASATQARIEIGQELPKGAMATIPPEFNQSILNLNTYFRIFCKNDPIAVNHNGRTQIVALNNLGVRQPAGPQDIPAFIQYFTRGTQFQINDALEYIIDTEDDNSVYDKYAMPVILFTANGNAAGNVILGPSDSLDKFNANGVVVTGASPQVFPGGYDFNNLTQVAVNSEKKMMGGVDIAKLNTKFSFPNFLLGEMLYKTPGAKEATGVFKMFNDKSSMEFWIKNYPGMFFPYNPAMYFFPPGYKLIERADGVIMYFNTVTNTLESNFPMGSYYILPQGADLNTVIKLTRRYNAIDGAVTAAVALIPPAHMSEPNIQRILQLVAYMTNLEEIKASFSPPIIPGGGGGKKKTKRTNIIKYMAKSKKKYHK